MECANRRKMFLLNSGGNWQTENTHCLDPERPLWSLFLSSPRRHFGSFYRSYVEP